MLHVAVDDSTRPSSTDRAANGRVRARPSSATSRCRRWLSPAWRRTRHDRTAPRASRRSRWRSAGRRAARTDVTSPKHAARRPNRRQHRRRNREQRQQLVVPAAVRRFEQLRARRVGGIAGVHGAAGQIPEQPAVDRAGAQLARSARRWHPGSSSSSQRILVAENSGSIVRPVVRLDLCLQAAARSSSQNSVVRRHCQTITGPSGARSSGPRPARTRAGWSRRRRRSGASGRGQTRRQRVSTLRQIARASCSTQPGCGNAIATGRLACATTAAASSNSSTFVFVVPWSIARMWDSLRPILTGDVVPDPLRARSRGPHSPLRSRGSSLR